jgi:dihydroxyacetone kinase-like predicted kinase
MAESALGSARGNSGVILSQVYEGFARGISPSAPERFGSVAVALREASRAADRTMSDPKEGTILTVLRAAADAAETHAGDPDPARMVLEARAAARRALEGTRDALPELRAAGVVDAGGKGMVLLLDALHAAVTDGPLSEPVGPFGPAGRAGVRQSELPTDRFELELRFGAPDAGPAREALTGVGSSVAVGGGPGGWLIHVHTSEPVAAAAAVADLGLTEVVSVAPLHSGAERVAACGLVSLAEAAGVADLLRSLGAVVVPYRSDGDLPSAPFDAAVGATGADDVVVLMPSAAMTVRHRSSSPRASASPRTRRLHVMVVAGPIATVAGAAAFDSTSGIDENMERMRSGARAVRELALSGATQQELELLDPLCEGSSPEAITMIVGEGPSAADRQRVEALLRERFPDVEIDVWEGGRGCPPFLIGLE